MRTRPRGVSDAEPPAVEVITTTTPVILSTPHIDAPIVPIISPRSPKKPNEVATNKPKEEIVKKEKREHKRDNVKETVVSPRVRRNHQEKTEEKKTI